MTSDSLFENRPNTRHAKSEQPELTEFVNEDCEDEHNAVVGDLRIGCFAGGCVWCMVAPFQQLPGVKSVTSGYIGGHIENPSYEDICTGESGHYEAVEVKYDPTLISYAELLKVFWLQIDPTDAGGQFADRGSQYHTAIFYHDADQKEIAEKSKQEEAAKRQQPIATKILEATKFYPAEEYHQDYHLKQPMHYKRYSEGSGRARYIEAAKRAGLSDIQCYVTQENGTERPFANEYWDHHEDGIYVDIVSGEALFASVHKFDSGTGWPSFYQCLESTEQREDTSHGMRRVEVRSRIADSHLGHLFPDGPKPTGLRYCINSAALRFIPVSEMEAAGYPQYLNLFNKTK